MTCSVHGVARGGIRGDGHCSICDKGYYGEDCDSGTVTDQEGNVYRTVMIGGKAWMAENYRRKPSGTYVDANEDNANRQDYGLLYSQSHAHKADFCPAGWHLPSRDEFQILIDYANTHRKSDTVNKALLKDQGDDFFFAARLAGYAKTSPLHAEGFGEYAYFWTSTQDDNNDYFAMSIEPSSDTPQFVEGSLSRYYSIRCVRDEECPDGYYGPYCERCPCEHGTCDSGVEGSGHCLSCEEGSPYYGPDCSILAGELNCVHGHVSVGVEGTGLCACDEGFGDPLCDRCHGGFYGENCDIFCSRPGGHYDQASAEACTLTETWGDQTETYQLVSIGSQLWMAENYRRETDDYAHCYGYDEELQDYVTLNATYGLRYNRETILADGFCPEGWHLPSKEEMEMLLAYVEEHRQSESVQAALASQSEGWQALQGTDEFGFGALPASFSGIDDTGFYLSTDELYLWSSDVEASPWGDRNDVLNIGAQSTGIFAEGNEVIAYSVRCLKDAGCEHGRYGKTCRLCSCAHGVCDDGLTGSGQCLSCKEGWKGDNCDQCTEGRYGQQCMLYGKMLDISGNDYRTVQIGDQTWMADNLRISIYHETPTYGYTLGEPPPYNASASDDGRLYPNQNLTQYPNLCPPGWRLPSVYDFQKLSWYVESHTTESELLLAYIAPDRLWTSHQNQGKDEFGFDARPVGSCWQSGNTLSTNNARYEDYGEKAYFWTSDTNNDDVHYYVELSDAGIFESKLSEDYMHYSIRCIQDE